MKVFDLLKKTIKFLADLFKKDDLSIKKNQQLAKGNFIQQAGRDVKNDK